MNVMVVLTSPERHSTSQMPKVLREMLYGDHPLLEMIEWTGCPNNGCEHSLTVNGKRSDVVAWLDLLRETFPQVSEEVYAIKRVIHLGFVQDPSGSMRIHLKKLTRVFTYEDRKLTRPWFWTPSWGDVFDL